jgi:hypothetical protein
MTSILKILFWGGSTFQLEDYGIEGSRMPRECPLSNGERHRRSLDAVLLAPDINNQGYHSTETVKSKMRLG